MFKAEPCGCNHRSCRDWHVRGVAAVQGVKFTKEQAEAVAKLLEFLVTRDLAELLRGLGYDNILQDATVEECGGCGSMTVRTCDCVPQDEEEN